MFKWFLLLMFSHSLAAQQLSDTSYHPVIPDPAFEKGMGPIVLLDEAHHNFHLLDGRYQPFARVIEADGFVVKPNREPFSEKALAEYSILVIANALNEKNTDRWELPTPSAFTEAEIRALESWVSAGGSLFLIADHMPFAGAAADLAKAFGFTFENGFALQSEADQDLFTKENSCLLEDTLLKNIRQVQTFTGQAFSIPGNAHGLLQLDSRYTLYLPKIAWEFERKCKIKPAAGLFQLAYLDYGKGKIVISGEAAMFSAQIGGTSRIGLTSPQATDNVLLLRRLVFWLSQ